MSSKSPEQVKAVPQPHGPPASWPPLVTGQPHAAQHTLGKVRAQCVLLPDQLDSISMASMQLLGTPEHELQDLVSMHESPINLHMSIQ